MDKYVKGLRHGDHGDCISECLQMKIDYFQLAADRKIFSSVQNIFFLLYSRFRFLMFSFSRDLSSETAVYCAGFLSQDYYSGSISSSGFFSGERSY